MPHRHRHAPHAEPAPARFSLLRASAGERLAMAAGVAGALWLVVLWAMR